MIGKIEFKRGFIAAATVFAAGLSLVGGSQDAHASQICTQHGEVETHLGKKFGETVTASGFDGAGNFVEVFASKKGTWTIVISVPGGLTCVIAAGEGWEVEDDPFPKPELAS